MYAIVSYDDTDETDFIPMKWITDDLRTHNAEVLINDRLTVQFYWSPWRNMLNISNARRHCVDAETGWPDTSNCRLVVVALI